MKSDILVWNCQGVGNLKFHRFLKEYLRDFDLDIVVLVEIRVNELRADNVIKSIGFPNSHKVEAMGFSGGIWLLWKDTVGLEVLWNDF